MIHGERSVTRRGAQSRTTAGRRPRLVMVAIATTSVLGLSAHFANSSPAATKTTKKATKRATTKKTNTTLAPTTAAPTTKPAPTTVSAAAAAAAATSSATERPPAGPCTTNNASRQTKDGKIRLVIGTGGTGGVFFPYGGGLARILSQKMPNVEATGQVTGGSVDNNKLLSRGDIDLGMTTADSGADAIAGLGVYKDIGPAKLCTIAVLYDSFIHIVALDSSGITNVAEMKGKRISVGSPGSSTEVAANRIIEAAGLKITDVNREFLSVAESVNAMKDKKIDAFFWIGGLPTAAVTDLTTSGPKVKFIDASGLLPTLKKNHGAVYYGKKLASTVYKGVDADVPGIGVDNLLVVNASMNENLVFGILDTLFSNEADVKAIHPEARSFSLTTATAISPIPFHPGAIRYYSLLSAYKP
jgi:uncharacterized protein